MDKLSAFWTRCDIVRREIMVLRCKYALKLHYDPTKRTDFTIEVPILLEKSSSKIIIEFDLNAKTLDKWPLGSHDLPTRVKIAYVLDGGVTIKYVFLILRSTVPDKCVHSVNTLLHAVQQCEVTLAQKIGIMVECCESSRAVSLSVPSPS
jgi:hypothetical protein